MNQVTSNMILLFQSNFPNTGATIHRLVYYTNKQATCMIAAI